MGVVCGLCRKLSCDFSLGRQVVASTSPLILSSGRVIDCALGRILDSSEPERGCPPHLSDFMLHQVLVEGMSDLQPTDELRDSYIVVAIIRQGHLDLEITDSV